METDRLWLSGLTVLLIILVVIIISVWVKLNNIRQKYKQLVNGAEGLNFEGLMIDMQNQLNELRAKSAKHERFLTEFGKAMKKMKSRLGIHRYNAFDTGGNDLSFSLAIIDEFEDGVVISAIHSREESYLYAKPLTKGQSKYAISPEEKEAINQALGVE